MSDVRIVFSSKGDKEIKSALQSMQTLLDKLLTSVDKLSTLFDKFGSSTTDKFKELGDAIGGTNSSVKKLNDSMNNSASTKATQSLNKYEQALKDAKAVSAQYAKELEMLAAKYGKTEAQLKGWLPSLQKAESYIRKQAIAMDLAGKNGAAYYENMSRLKIMSKQLETETGKLNSSVNGSSRAFGGLLPHVASVTLSYMAMRKIVAGLKGAFAIGMEFEHEMAMVRAIAQATTNQFVLLNETAKKAGETTVYTAKESAEALRYMAMAGFTTNEMLVSLNDVLNLAFIGQLELKRATDISTDVLRAFGLEAEKLKMVVDTFTATITGSNTNVEMLGQAMKFVAPIASKLGYTVQETSAMIGILSQSGIKAGMAGRSLRMAMLRLNDAAARFNLEGKDLISILKEMSSRDYSPERLVSQLKTMFGLRATPAMLALMQNLEQYDAFYERVQNSAGASDRFMSSLQTVWRALKEFTSIVQSYAIDVFERYQERLESLFKNLTQFFREHKDTFINTAEVIIDIIPKIMGALLALGTAHTIGKIALGFKSWATELKVVGATATMTGGLMRTAFEGVAFTIGYLIGNYINELIDKIFDLNDAVRSLPGAKEERTNLKNLYTSELVSKAVATSSESTKYMEQAFSELKIKDTDNAIKGLQKSLNSLNETKNKLLANNKVLEESWYSSLIPTAEAEISDNNRVLEVIEKDIAEKEKSLLQLQEFLREVKATGGDFTKTMMYLAGDVYQQKQIDAYSAQAILKELMVLQEGELEFLKKEEFIAAQVRKARDSGLYSMLVDSDKKDGEDLGPKNADKYLREVETNAARIYETIGTFIIDLQNRLEKANNESIRSDIQSKLNAVQNMFTNLKDSEESYTKEYTDTLIKNNRLYITSIDERIREQEKAEQEAINLTEKYAKAEIEANLARSEAITKDSKNTLDTQFDIERIAYQSAVENALKQGKDTLAIKQDFLAKQEEYEKNYGLILEQEYESQLKKLKTIYEQDISNTELSVDQKKQIQESYVAQFIVLNQKLSKSQSDLNNDIDKWTAQQVQRELDLQKERADKILEYNRKSQIRAIEQTLAGDLLIQESKEQTAAKERELFEDTALQRIKTAMKNEEDISQIRSDALKEVEERNEQLKTIYENSKNLELAAEQEIFDLKKKSGVNELQAVKELHEAKYAIGEKWNKKIQALGLERKDFEQAIDTAIAKFHQQRLDEALTAYNKYVEEVAKKGEEGLTREQARTNAMLKFEKDFIGQANILFKNGYYAEWEEMWKMFPELQKIMLAKLSKEEGKYRNDELQALKSLYQDMGKISGNYYDMQMQIIEMEYEKYMELLHLKKDGYATATAEEKAKFDALNEWKRLESLRLYQELLVAEGGFFGGVEAYLIQNQIDWENHLKLWGEMGEEAFELLGETFEDTLVSAMKGNFDDIGDLWDKLLDDMLDMFYQTIAQIIKMWAVSGLTKLFVGNMSISVSGSGGSPGASSFIGGGTAGGGDLMGSIMSGLGLAKSGVEMYYGKSLVSMAFNYVSSALFGGAATVAGTTGATAAGAMGANLLPATSALYYGYGATTPAAYFGAGAAASGAGPTVAAAGAQYASLGSISAAAPYVAVMLAASQIIGAVMGNNLMNKGDAHMDTMWNLKTDDAPNRILGANLIGIENDGFESDAQGSVNMIAGRLAETIETYNSMFSYLSKESQNKIREAMGDVDWKDFQLQIVHWANEAQTVAAQTGITGGEGYVAPTYGVQIGSHYAENLVANQGTAIYGSARGGSPAQSVQDLVGQYFEEYVEEALTSIMGSDIAQKLRDDLINDPALSKEGFVNDIDGFQQAWIALTDSIAKATHVYEGFESWVSGSEKPYTEMDKAIANAGVAAQAYANQMAALGQELSESQIKDVFNDVLKNLLVSVESFDAITKPLSLMDVAAIEASASFSAYIDKMREAGIDIEKLGDIEAKRAQVIERAQQQLLDQMNNTIESTISGLLGMTSATENAVANVSTQFQNIYALMETTAGIADYTEQIEAISAQLGDTSNMTKEEIDQLNNTLNTLTDSTAEYNRMKERELEVIKSTMGLGPSGQELRGQQISGTYGIAGEEQARAAMEWFRGASWVEIEAMAETFGVTTSDIINDIAWMIDNWDLLGTKAADSAAAQAAAAATANASIQSMLDTLNGVSGNDRTMAEISKTYGMDPSSMTTDWMQSVIDAVKGMSPEEITAALEGTGISVETFTQHILFLSGVLDEATASQADAISSIEEAQKQLKGISDYDDVIAKYNLGGLNTSELQAIVDAFKNGGSDAVYDYLHALGLSDDAIIALTGDILTLNDGLEAQRQAYENNVLSIEEAQKKLKGVSEYADVISKYNLEGVGAKELRDIIDAFTNGDVDAIIKYLEALGYTPEMIDALTKDILILNDGLENVLQSIQDQIDEFNGVSATQRIKEKYNMADYTDAQVIEVIRQLYAMGAEALWDYLTITLKMTEEAAKQLLGEMKTFTSTFDAATKSISRFTNAWVEKWNLIYDAIEAAREKITELRKVQDDDSIGAGQFLATTEKYKKYMGGNTDAESINQFIDMFMNSNDIHAIYDRARIMGVTVEELMNDLVLMAQYLSDVSSIIAEAKENLGSTSDADKMKELETIFGPLTSGKAEELIQQFLDSSVDEITRFADSLGISVEDLIGNLEYMKDYFEKMTDTIAGIKERLNDQSDTEKLIDIEKIFGNLDAEKVNTLIQQFLGSSVDEIIAWADSLGISVEDLGNNLEWLKGYFESSEEAVGSFMERMAEFDAAMERIESNLKSVIDSIAEYNWKVATGGSSADYLMHQIQGILALGATATMTDLETLSQLIAQWHSAASAEGQAAWEAEQRAEEGWWETISKLEDLVAAVDQAIENIKYSDLNLSLPPELLVEAEQDYAALKAKADSGTVEDVNEFLSFTSKFLEIAQSAHKSDETYQGLYATVMSDIESYRGRAESGQYDEQVWHEPNIPEPPLGTWPGQAGVNAQFEALLATLNSMTTALKTEMVLTIDWANFDGDTQDVVDMLSWLFANFEPGNPIVLEWIHQMALDWASKQDIDKQMEILQFLMDQTGAASAEVIEYVIGIAMSGEFTSSEAIEFLGRMIEITGLWDSPPVLAFLSNLNLDGWVYEDFISMLTAITAVTDDWNSPAALAFITNIASSGSMTVQEIKDMVEFLSDKAIGGWESPATLAFLSNLDISGWVVEDMKDMMDYLADKTGDWNSPANLEFIANVASNGSLDILQTKEIVEFLSATAEGAWESPATLAFLSNLDLSGWTVEEMNDMMNYLVEKTGDWNSPASLEFIANVAATGSMDIQQTKDMVQYLSDTAEGAWESPATLAFISNLDLSGWSASDITDMMDYLVETTGSWESPATLAFIASVAATGSMDIQQTKDMVQYLSDTAEGAWESPATLAFVSNLDLSGWSVSDITDMMDYLVETTGSWESPATLGFIANITSNAGDPATLDAIIVNIMGAKDDWNSPAALTFLANVNTNLYTVEQLGDQLEYLITTAGGWESEAVKTFYANLERSGMDMEQFEYLRTPTDVTSHHEILAEKNPTYDEVMLQLKQVFVESINTLVAALEDNYSNKISSTWVPVYVSSANTLSAGLHTNYNSTILGWPSTAVLFGSSNTLNAGVNGSYYTTINTWPGTAKVFNSSNTMTAVTATNYATTISGWAAKILASSNTMTAATATNYSTTISGWTAKILASSNTMTGYWSGDTTTSGLKAILTTAETIAKSASVTTSGSWSGDTITTGLKAILGAAGTIANPITKNATVTTKGSWYGGGDTPKIQEFLTSATLTGATITANAGWGTGTITDKIKNWLTSTAPLEPEGVVTTKVAWNMGDSTTKALYDWLAGTTNPTGKITAIFDVTTQADLTAISKNTKNTADILSRWSGYSIRYAEGGIVNSPTHALIGEAGYPEAVIPMKDGVNIPVKWISGGTTQAGAEVANDEEVALLRELIDVLKAKNTSPTVTVNVDSKGIIKEAGKYVSERTRRGTLDVRAN